MSNKIALVMHDDAHEEYAAALAAALTPVRAITTSFAKARELTFGSGAACVMVCPPAPDASGFAHDVAAHLSRDAVAICFGDAALPKALLDAGARAVRGGADVAADAKLVAKLLSEPADDDLAGLKTHRVAMGGSGAAVAPSNGGENRVARLATRSVFGMAVTVAVVGVASQYIGARARANVATPPADGALTTVSAALPRAPVGDAEIPTAPLVAPVEELTEATVQPALAHVREAEPTLLGFRAFEPAGSPLIVLGEGLPALMPPADLPRPPQLVASSLTFGAMGGTEKLSSPSAAPTDQQAKDALGPAVEHVAGAPYRAS